MSRQTTLLTSHKGVDLHVATAFRVMRERLEGGEALRGLFRCEFFTFAEGDHGLTMDRLLDAGKYYNPNKHHFGHFEGSIGSGLSPIHGSANGSANGPANGSGETSTLSPHWPGQMMDTDLKATDEDLYDVLLGGRAVKDCCAVDLAAFALGQDGPLISGVLWRLVLGTNPDTAAQLGEQLAVARGRKQGLLINPHMEGWLTAVRQETR